MTNEKLLKEDQPEPYSETVLGKYIRDLECFEILLDSEIVENPFDIDEVKKFAIGELEDNVFNFDAETLDYLSQNGLTEDFIASRTDIVPILEQLRSTEDLLYSPLLYHDFKNAAGDIYNFLVLCDTEILEAFNLKTTIKRAKKLAQIIDYGLENDGQIAIQEEEGERAVTLADLLDTIKMPRTHDDAVRHLEMLQRECNSGKIDVPAFIDAVLEDSDRVTFDTLEQFITIRTLIDNVSKINGVSYLSINVTTLRDDENVPIETIYSVTDNAIEKESGCAIWPTKMRTALIQLRNKGIQNPEKLYPELNGGLNMTAYMAGQRQKTFELIDGVDYKSILVGFPA